MTSQRRIRWDPIVLGPPALALIAVLSMLMTIADPIPRAPVPAPDAAPREVRIVPSSLMTASTRPATSRLRRPSIGEETILPPQPTGSALVTEVLSPLLIIPVSGPLELKSVQAP